MQSARPGTGAVASMNSPSPSPASSSASPATSSRIVPRATAPAQGADAATIPLSSPQERLWFLEQFNPGDLAYVTPLVARITGPLDLQALRQSINEIVRRHESFRTAFGDVNGVPFQQVLPAGTPAVTIDVAVDDLSHLPEPQRAARADAIALAQSRIPFDLSQAPLLRLRLVRLHDESHLLAGALHHIIADGWSISVFVSELAQIYDAFVQGRPSPLPELSIQFPDYALWQRHLLQGAEMDRLMAHWKRQLSGDLPVLDLPTDRPRPPLLTHAGHRVRRPLPAALVDAIKRISRESRVTPFMTLLAAFNVLLHRYSGQTDLIIGTPVANRTRVQTEAMIGNFVNTLALRTDLAGDPAFSALLTKVRDLSLAALAHQDMPFEQLVQELAPPRDPSRSPVFQVAFGLQNIPRDVHEAAGVRFERVRFDNHTAKFDLSVEAVPHETGMTLIAEYRTDLFDEASIARLLGHFEVLLTGIATDPHQPISRLPLLDDQERHRVLIEWNGSARFEPREHDCIHHRFERAAATTPDAVAVTHEGRSVTYAALNAQANQLANQLRSLGVGPGLLVGVFLDRSIDLIAALPAVLKAGGAYVPMDPIYPTQRLAMVLEDAAPVVVITQSSLLPKLPATRATILCLDRPADAALLRSQSDHNLATPSRPHDLAYVIFTSGSTGRPKGVMVTHHNVTRLFDATDHWFGFNADDVWTMFHSAAFDFSVWEIWGALLHGGRLVVIGHETSRSPHACHELLIREGVTVLNQTPSAFYPLIRVDGECVPSQPLKLRLVIFGGEALEPSALMPWFDRHGDELPQMINMYGITETTVHVTHQRIRRADARGDVGSVIGVPIPDLQVYLFDRAGQPVPIGVPGEIHVGGGGVARGYLNQPQLTAQRFIPDLFTADTQGTTDRRLYRSGDLARWLADGRLQYLGRIDTQVQVRGFRVELGEIEPALRRHPAIDGALVISSTGAPTGPRLIAYVVPKAGMDATASQLRTHLRTLVPDYMVPDAFVPLAAFPLTPHGKIDHRALPEAGADRPEQDVPYTAPRNDTERRLAEIWSQVLGIERVGIHDSFFDLGGHSLIATTLVAAIRDAMQAHLPLSAMFEHPTIAQLVGLLQPATKAKPEMPLLAGGIGRTGRIENKPPVGGDSAIDPNSIRNQIDQLTDEEVIAMLSRRGADGI